MGRGIVGIIISYSPLLVRLFCVRQSFPLVRLAYGGSDLSSLGGALLTCLLAGWVISCIIVGRPTVGRVFLFR
ncbi:hypothetical protein JB92DRAFT_2952584 [Gautieria morchelliformis]|nr:hypothetical protein JB92DRAFT_2952584 [Gautieria morchelliformis]